MKALLWTKYGGAEFLMYGDTPLPEPAKGEVRIRVHAAGLNAADLHLMRADPFPVRLMSGLTRPRFTALGADMSGVVDAVGPGVTQFRPGDPVMGDLSGFHWGGLAEFVTAPVGVLVAKPVRWTHTEAAATPMASVTAYQSLVTHGNLKAGQNVLVHGASGGVGTFSVQIAKALGAQVTAVCSRRNLDLVKALGADEVIDYQSDDFTRRGPVFDLIHAANGDRPLADFRRALTPTGTFVNSGGSMRQLMQAMFVGPWFSMTSGQRFKSMLAQSRQADLEAVANLPSVKPVIDQVFPLIRGAEALAYLEQGHAQGKVVVQVVEEAFAR